MKKITAIGYGAALLVALAVSSCSDSKGWKVTGTIENANEGGKVSLEHFNGAQWYTIDSLSLSKNGAFSYASATPAQYADVYRLSMDGKAIYFPIDSIDHLQITANAENFDQDYQIEGTPYAVQLMNVDRTLSAAVAQMGPLAAVADSALKYELNQQILADSVGVLAYYLVNKTLGGLPLYSPERLKDLKMIGAVANKFAVNFPDDPRTKFLANRYITARKSAGQSLPQALEALEIGIIEIDLYNPKGEKKSLTEAVSNADVTVLSFTSYGIENSVPYNIELKRLYDKYADNNIAIYQVAIDENEAEWLQAAKNLPWIAVRPKAEELADILVKYNVAAVPTAFIINRNGDLVERVEDATELEAAIKRAL